MHSKIKLFQWGALEYPLNFGDLISKRIIENITNNDEIVVVDKKHAELLAVGSILNDLEHKFPKAKLIWGSGFIEQCPQYEEIKLKVAAVRGKLTAEILGFNGPMGDPGLLVSKYFTKGEKVKGRIGIVPHFLDKKNVALDKYRNNENYFVIDVERQPEEVIKDITSCEIIYSSSMHGLIVSDSFNIPNFYIEFSKKTHGTDFKFQDYYSVLQRDFSDAVVSSFFDENYETLYGRANNWVGIQNITDIQDDLIKALIDNVALVETDSEEEILTDVDRLYDGEFDGRDVKIFTQYRPFKTYGEYTSFKKYMENNNYHEVYQNSIYTLYRVKSPFNILIAGKLFSQDILEDYGGRVQRKLVRLIAKSAYAK